MADKISVKIALDGGAEVEKQLAAIGETGTAAFTDLSEASAKAGETTQQTGEGLDKVQGSADKAADSISKLSLESVKTGAEIAKLTAEIAKIGVEITLAIQRHRSWIKELFHLASSANTAVRALGLLAPELAVMGTAFATAAIAVGGAALAFEAIEKTATAAAKSYEKLNNSLQTLSKNTEQSFDSLQKGQAAFEQIGISADKFSGIVTKLGEAVGGLNVGTKIQEEFNKVLESEKAMLEAQLKLQELGGPRAAVGTYERLRVVTNQLEAATGDLAKAQDDATAKAETFAKNTANDLQKLLPIVKQITAGQKGLTFDSLVTAESKINAVAASMKNAATTGQTAGEVLVRFIASADRASAIQVAKGFGITDEDVDRIQNLGGKLDVVDQIWKRIQGAGVLIPPESAEAFERMRVSIQSADAAWARLQQSLQSPVFATEAAKISGDLNTIKAGVFNFAAAAIDTFGRVASGMAQGFQAGIQTTIQEFTAVGAVLTEFGRAALLVFTNPLEALNQLIAGIGNLVSSITGITWDAVANAGVAAWNALTGAIQRTIDAVLRFLGLRGGGPVPEGQGGIGSNASGGLLGGRGTGTSDSNLAWVSRGEHIMPARAVRQPGVLAFLEALRRSGGDLAAVLDGMGRFALGGMVPRAIPVFATGGLAGGSNVTIQFPGLPPISGLRASADVVDQLHKAAALAQVRSGGRKPSRYS